MIPDYELRTWATKKLGYAPSLSPAAWKIVAEMKANEEAAMATLAKQRGSMTLWQKLAFVYFVIQLVAKIRGRIWLRKILNRRG